MAEMRTAAHGTARGWRTLVAPRRVRAWARPLIGLVVLVAVVVRVGPAPFAEGLLGIDPVTVSSAVAICAVSTAASAWRWRVVANRLGVRIGFRNAIGMYYRSQFLNAVLPGGVLGDVHRAVAHGVDVHDVPQASRAVAIERVAGQAVQAVVTLVVLGWAGAEFAGWALAQLGIGLALLLAALAAAAASRKLRRIVVRELVELRVGLGAPRAAVQVLAASLVAVSCHVALFAIAVAGIGVHLPPLRLVALALVVLLGASIPVNVGGWGPREGVAAWAFAMAGLGSAAGVAASTAFGVLVMIAVLPGAVVALVAAIRPASVRPSVVSVSHAVVPVTGTIASIPATVPAGPTGGRP